MTPERLDEIRQLDENDARETLSCAVGELLDEVERLTEIALTALPITRNSREFNRQWYLTLRDGIKKLLADPPGGDLESNREWSKPLKRLLLGENTKPKCECGDADATWHGEYIRVYVCDDCWRKLTTVTELE